MPRDLWFSPTPNMNAGIRLFCIPYAGGDARAIYRRWEERIHPSVQVVSVNLPGRGRRIAEPLLDDLKVLAKQIFAALGSFASLPLALWGHSMGALIAFELARMLTRSGAPLVHLFASGTKAPHFEPCDVLPDGVSDVELLANLKELNGTPKEVFNNPELLKLILPIIKSDFRACKAYKYVPEDPLRCAVTVFGGKDDRAKEEELDGWRDHTCGHFMRHVLPGDHFFIRSSEDQVLHAVCTALGLKRRAHKSF